MRRVLLVLLLFALLALGGVYAQTAVTHRKLHFSSAELSLNADKTLVTLTVYFKDPAVKDSDSTMLSREGSRYTETMTRTWDVPKQLKVLDFNRLVTLSSAVSGSSLELYVAVYWERDTMDQPALCISVEPIPVDWWRSDVSKASV